MGGTATQGLCLRRQVQTSRARCRLGGRHSCASLLGELQQAPWAFPGRGLSLGWGRPGLVGRVWKGRQLPNADGRVWEKSVSPVYETP